MPVDYSKWDALELSDDSDIEVHPNVDKRSFIRAKQNQIHQQRIDRKHRIVTLKYERVINDGLLARIDGLLRALNRHKKELKDQNDASSIDELVFESLMDVTSDSQLGDDHPAAAPPGVHTNEEQPSYSKMMGALVDQVKLEVDRLKPVGAERLAAYIREVAGHNKKVQDLQKDLNIELSKLEKEEGAKITSESIHTGFDSSFVAKPSPLDSKSAASRYEPELLNPAGAKSSSSSTELTTKSGAANNDDDDDIAEASPTAKKFGKIAFGDYRASLQFISSHPEILAERETDGLLVEAFDAQTKAETPKDEDYARQCVHQALLLQYCRQLGKDGVGLFFQRVQTPGHQARKLFLDDVNTTYNRIRTRTAELKQQTSGSGSGDKEQIQLHAVNPNTSINITTPPPLDQCHTDDERASRAIFDTFAPELQQALQSGSLDAVNQVLGELSVEQAERVVEQLGDGGMLSLEEGVIDATTEEGKRQIEQIEKTHQMPSSRLEEIAETEDPGMD